MLGADTHKRSHTIAAIAAGTGERTVAVGRRGFGALLQWARSVDEERVWACEGKRTREAIRCLKRYLARRVWRLLQPPNPETGQPHPSIS